MVNLYPKEWLVTEMGQDELLSEDLAQLRSVEPWWKLLMANKAMLPMLTEYYG
jgi:glutathionylspermidine synthase